MKALSSLHSIGIGSNVEIYGKMAIKDVIVNQWQIYVCSQWMASMGFPWIMTIIDIQNNSCFKSPHI